MQLFKAQRATASSIAALLMSTGAMLSPALADAGSKPIPEGHAPAGVMVDHMHKAGEFMVGYRYSYSRMAGDTLTGTDTAPEHDILHDACQNPKVAGHEHCMMKQSKMTMQMHMLDLMYAPTNWLTFMVMPQWMTMDMTMSPVEDPMHMGEGGEHGMHMGSHAHGTDGFGDTTFGALIQLSDGPGYHLHTGLMFSAPTGSTSEKGSSGALTHYMMQLGSGTWDFLPSLTYTGRADRFSWGGQVSGIIRMEDENNRGYALGNVFQATAWGSYRLTDWLSASLRVLHTKQGEITGTLDHTGTGMSPPDLPSNYGGRFWDVGFGLNMVVPEGALKGHRLSVEWAEPVRDDVNGFQQERDGTLYVNWSKAF
ncbi:MAG: transporter [Hyphomicrobium sp.]|nr:transporter [Hyphomicrobium sp.]